MKRKSTLIFYQLFLAVGGLLLTACSTMENTQGSESRYATVIASKEKVTGNDRPVKIYPDLVKRVIHVKNIDENPLDFYVFDLEGTLIVHFKMEEKEHKKISTLNRGTYVYEVFVGDEMTDSGKIFVK